MKRAAVFAHYDKDSIIDDYVIYYIENLKKVADIIIFVSCNNLAEEEKNKIKVNHIIAEEHKEYDFGSYKRGFLYLKENNLLDDVDELILANDSCYAPLFPFEDMFNKMEKEPCDFWVVTKNNHGTSKKIILCFYKREIRPHIQSYFLVLKNNVFSSTCFINFLKNVSIENSKKDIISKYEIGLSEDLVKNNFKYNAYVKSPKNSGNLTIFKWKKLIQLYKSPCLKCSLARDYNYEQVGTKDLESVVLNNTKYPINLIQSNVQRTRFVRRKLPGPDIIRRIYYIFVRFLRIFNISISHLIIK